LEGGFTLQKLNYILGQVEKYFKLLLKPSQLKFRFLFDTYSFHIFNLKSSSRSKFQSEAGSSNLSIA